MLKQEQGLTLIEIIVAVGVFGIVTSMSIGIFTLATVSQRRIVALKNVEDNLRFATESMAREIRTGTNFTNNANALSFINAKGVTIVYHLNANTNVIEKSSDGGLNYSTVTGSEIKVNYLNFYLTGKDPDDGSQPRITLTMGATSKVGNQSASLKIQTTISSRSLY